VGDRFGHTHVGRSKSPGQSRRSSTASGKSRLAPSVAEASSSSDTDGEDSDTPKGRMKRQRAALANKDPPAPEEKSFAALHPMALPAGLLDRPAGFSLSAKSSANRSSHLPPDLTSYRRYALAKRLDDLPRAKRLEELKAQFGAWRPEPAPSQSQRAGAGGAGARGNEGKERRGERNRKQRS
jgi:hypothetical protein